MDLSVTGPKVYVRIEWLYQKFAGTMVDMFGNFGNIVTQTTVSLFAVTVLILILAKPNICIYHHTKCAYKSN